MGEFEVVGLCLSSSRILALLNKEGLQYLVSESASTPLSNPNQLVNLSWSHLVGNEREKKERWRVAQFATWFFLQLWVFVWYFELSCDSASSFTFLCYLYKLMQRNMDLYDHEEMIIKHVTSCSSNQSSSSSSRNRRPSRYTKGQNDNLFLSIVSHSVRKETSDKLVANPLPIESLQDRQCSIVSHDSEDQPARKNTPFQQIKQVIAAEDSIEKNLLFSSTESNEENTFIRTPPHASSKLGEDSPAPLERCPVCFLQFQRQVRRQKFLVIKLWANLVL